MRSSTPGPPQASNSSIVTSEGHQLPSVEPPPDVDVTIKQEIVPPSIQPSLSIPTSSSNSDNLERSPPFRVKRERSLSPILPPDPPIPRTQGTYRIAAVPPDCQSSHPNYKENRKLWVSAERRKMVTRGLTIQRSFFRYAWVSFDILFLQLKALLFLILL